MKEYKLDFDDLLNRVPIQRVAEEMLGLKLRPHKDEFRSTCPIHDSSDNRHFVLTPSMNRFVCFCEGCKHFPRRGGDAIELVRRLHKLGSQLAAAKEIAKHFGIEEAKESAASNPEPDNAEKFDAKAFQQRLKPEHEALVECGVSMETIRRWGGGYCPNGSLAGRLALPICDINGSIKAFLGVALKGEEPQIKYPKGYTPPYFFGVHKLAKGLDLHIVWHPLDVLRYAEDGVPNVIAILRYFDRDCLTHLTALVDDREITGLEFH